MRKPIPFDPMSRLPAEIQFNGPLGERCIRLGCAWPVLFDHINRLGNLMVGFRTGDLTLVTRHLPMDFQPIPGGSEWIDLRSDWILETGAIASAIGVDERATGRNLEFSLQFFDSEAHGLFKLILMADADLRTFEKLLRNLALECRSPCACGTARPNQPPCPRPESTRPDACDAGSCALIKTLLMAHFRRVPLRFTLRGTTGQYSSTLVPHVLERSGDHFFISDHTCELYLADVPALRVTRAFEVRRMERVVSLAIELDDGRGCRIDFAGTSEQFYLWEELHGSEADSE